MEHGRSIRFEVIITPSNMPGQIGVWMGAAPFPSQRPTNGCYCHLRHYIHLGNRHGNHREDQKHYEDYTSRLVRENMMTAVSVVTHRFVLSLSNQVK